MTGNPYQPTLTDETSGIEVPDIRYRIWEDACHAAYNKRDPELAEFQKANCVGCRFADPEKVGTDAGCCTYPGHLEIDAREDIPTCLSRREEHP